MTEDHSSELLGQLPRTRPHRRSAKRPARPANGGPDGSGPTPAQNRRSAKQADSKPAGQQRAARKRPAGKPAAARAKRLPQPAQPRGVPSAARQPASETAQKRVARAPTPVLRTAAQAASELAEIGLTLSTRALRRAIGRLPRP